MKKIILISGIVSMLLLFVKCENDAEHDADTNELEFVGTVPGGCNLPDGEFKSAEKKRNDSVIFYMKRDTLHAFVGLNYFCCALLASETNFANDTIVVIINDECNYPSEECYCRCKCFYTWDFSIKGFGKKTLGYKVILNSPMEEEPIIIQQGNIDLCDFK